MLEKLKLIENLVFVGGFAAHKHGKKKEYSDIDIVILDENDLPFLKLYNTDSKFSKSGKRGFYVDGNIKLDVFIEEKLPEYTTIDGFKCQTLESIINYYENIYTFVDNHWKNAIDEKLKLLK